MYNEQEIKKYIVAKAYTTYPTNPVRVTVTWEALEYNQYKKAFTPVATGETEKDVLDELDRRFNGGSEEDKIKERIKKIDPDLLKRALEEIRREEAAKELPALETLPTITRAPGEILTSEGWIKPPAEKVSEKPPEQVTEIEE